MRALSCLLCVALFMLSSGCGREAPKGSPTVTDMPEAPRAGDSGRETVSLPHPRTKGGLSLEETLNRRQSWRVFQDRPLTLEEVGQLLWAAGGMKADAASGATRTAPSAGGIYPLHFFLVCGNVEGLPAGVYRYEPSAHALEALSSGDRRKELARAAMGQVMVAEAPASLVITADYEWVEARYGERGWRYAHLDAGCASQNLALQAVSLGLGTVVVGAFDDDAVGRIVGETGTPLVIMPVGRP